MLISSRIASKSSCDLNFEKISSMSKIMPFLKQFSAVSHNKRWEKRQILESRLSPLSAYNVINDSHNLYGRSYTDFGLFLELEICTVDKVLGYGKLFRNFVVFGR